MIRKITASKKYSLVLIFVITALISLPGFGINQNKEEISGDDLNSQEQTNSRQTYTPEFFEHFAPKNAYDMLSQVPGFSIRNTSQGRGLGQASVNVLINGQRLSSKSEDATDLLRRITSENVEKIEIIDGASLGIPGLSGQVANVITKKSGISGQYRYNASYRPKYAEPSYIGGEVSV